MAKSQKNSTRGTSLTRSYDLYGIGGDLESLVNMYVDYDCGKDGIETIPGFRVISSLGEKINGLFRARLSDGKEYLIIHAGAELYKLPVAKTADPEWIGNLKDAPSTAFTLGECLYILDGEKITEIASDGSVKNVASAPYVPTTHKNGLAYEQRNLLTKWSYQEYEVATAEEFAYGSPHLLYSVTSYKDRVCAVSGVDKTKTGKLFIPSYKYIGGIRYAVTEILPHALEGSRAEEVTVAEGVTKIGDNAVRSCTKLKRVILPSSLTEIGKYAFASAPLLEYVRLGLGLSAIGTGVFANCPALLSVAYEGDSAQLAAIEGHSALASKTMQYNVTYTTVTVAFSTHGGGFEPLTVYIDGVSVPFTQPSPDEVRIELDYKSDIEGKLVRIYGSETSEVGMRGELGADLVALYNNKISPEAAILGCKISTVFDGRVFLSGNPMLPGVVFYSTETCDGEISPYYFGSYDFFTTGNQYPVTALLSLSDALIVTKSADAGEGSILYYEKGGTTSVPRSTRYKKTDAYRAQDGVSGAHVFSGEPLFISDGRLCGIDGSPKSLVPYSNRLSDKSVPYSEIFSLEWQGYLVLGLGERIVLIDKRGDGKSFRFYPLSDIGSWENSTRVCIYANSAAHGLAVSEKPGKVEYKSVISEILESGEAIHYVIENGIKIAVTPTEEWDGGTFSPARRAVSVGNLLYFGTDSGEVCLFNTDKRGVAPNRVKSDGKFDSELYERVMGDKIHPDFYDFAGHRIHFSLATKNDDCGDGTIYKSTSQSGTVLNVSATAVTAVSLSTVCDGEVCLDASIPTGPLDFSTLDFSKLSFSPECEADYALSEKRRLWVRRRSELREADFRAPVKINSLSVAYKTERQIKG